MKNQSRVEEFNRIYYLYLANGTNISTLDLPYLFEPVIWKYPDAEGFAKIFACLVIIIGGLLGNIGITLTVTLTKTMWTTINFCMVNLAIADAMICIFCMVPYAVDVVTVNVYIWGNVMCKFNPFIQMTCLICSVFTLSAMSCNRFIAIMFPIHARTRKFRLSVLVTIIWLISMFLSSPLLILKDLDTIQWKDFNETKCPEKWPEGYEYLRRIYYITICVSLFFIPGIIMISSNSLVLYKLWTVRIPGEHTENNENIRSRTKRKWTVMVFLMLIVFIVCWTPMLVMHLYGFLSPEKKSMPDWFNKFHWFSFFMAYTNSFMNPIIYGGFNEAFRRRFYSLLRCKNQRERFRESVRSRITYTTSIISSVTRRLSRSLSGNSKLYSNASEMPQNVPSIPGKQNLNLSNEIRKVQSL